MNTSDLVVNLPTWLSWASVALYVGYFVLGVVTIVIFSGIAAETMVDEERETSTKAF